MKVGYVYRIVCNTTGLQYYGSTYTQQLSKRLWGHRNHYNKYKEGKGCLITSIKILENDNYEIILVETVKTETKQELLMRERFHIESNVCVNKNIPTRTMKEWNDDNKEKIKEYRDVNKEKKWEYNKEYYYKNREKLKEYYYNNKEKLCEYNKEYKEINNEKISKYNKQYRKENHEKLKEKIKFI
jgi:hypothetical protein